MTRFTPSQLRRMADWPHTENLYNLQQALRQAAEDAEDAERYRWLRSEASDFFFAEYNAEGLPSGKRLDQAIDTVRRTQEKQA